MRALYESGRFAPLRAVVISMETLGTQEGRLGRILTFFGVPWHSVSMADLDESGLPPESCGPYAVFGSADVLTKALALPRGAALVCGAAAMYAYASEDWEASRRAVSALASGEWVWVSRGAEPVSVEITDQCRELTGPMSGIRVKISLAAQDRLLAPSERAVNGPSDDGQAPGERFTSIVSVDGLPAFFRVLHNRVPTYFCASTTVVDIDAPVGRNYFDVKAHFLSAVPLMMFITWAFRDVMWRPYELGACLIIDDPLLKRRYGFCDFEHLLGLMGQHRFTANIAFIPWNWQRTKRADSEFFRRESPLFSVSIHGCDHIAAECGTTSLDELHRIASTAQTRMAKHRQRTQLEHDPVMVFPQGVFSSACPGVLKQHGFIAAVNTEVGPSDKANAATTIGDVWDVAILKYGAFPIYTRRYAFHGIENFAFDMLLGKPCFIVAHHQFFSDGGTKLVELLEQLALRGCALTWRSPREIIRRAYRWRGSASGEAEIQMYGNELLVANRSDTPMRIQVFKREIALNIVAHIESAGTRIRWENTEGGLTFSDTVPQGAARLFALSYEIPPRACTRRKSAWYEMSVTARRILSEFRDEYVQKIGGASI